jgi:hypothetical protein
LDLCRFHVSALSAAGLQATPLFDSTHKDPAGSELVSSLPKKLHPPQKEGGRSEALPPSFGRINAFAKVHGAVGQAAGRA